MARVTSLTITLLALLGCVVSIASPGNGKHCLSEAEAWHISRRWLSIFSTGQVTSKSELATIVAKDLKSYDDTFGPPTTNLNQLWKAISGTGKTTTTDVEQYPLFLINTCDQIAVHWQYAAVTTGYNSTVPKGTKVGFQGNDILHIDLDTRLIFNATSCGDWILLAQQLGDSCNV